MNDFHDRMKELGIDPDKIEGADQKDTLNMVRNAMNEPETKDEERREDIIYNNYDEIPDEVALEKEQINFTEERITELSEQAEALKNQANELFREGKFEEALNIYCEGIDCAPAVKKKQRAVLFANRAATKIKMGSPKAAIDDCSHAIELDDKYIRAFHR